MKHPVYIDTIKQGDCIKLMSEMSDEYDTNRNVV